MTERPTADIITFPRKSPDRLTSALLQLDAALAAQRLACAQWRRNLGELHGAVQGLQGSLRRYDAALGTLAANVDSLGVESRRLEATAGQALARAHS